MEPGAPFDIKPAGMLALDVARVEAGLLLIDVDFFSSKKALIESQKYSPYEMGLGRLVSPDKGRFIGQQALRDEAPARPRAPDRRARDRLDRRRDASTRRLGLPPTVGATASRVGGAGVPRRPPGRARDDDDVVAGAEEDDRARHRRSPALRRRHRRCRSRSRSKRCGTGSTRPSCQTPFFNPPRKTGDAAGLNRAQASGLRAQGGAHGSRLRAPRSASCNSTIIRSKA